MFNLNSESLQAALLERPFITIVMPRKIWVVMCKWECRQKLDSWNFLTTELIHQVAVIFKIHTLQTLQRTDECFCLVYHGLSKWKSHGLTVWNWQDWINVSSCWMILNQMLICDFKWEPVQAPHTSFSMIGINKQRNLP